MEKMNLQTMLILGIAGFIAYQIYKAREQATVLANSQQKASKQAMEMAQNIISTI